MIHRIVFARLEEVVENTLLPQLDQLPTQNE